MREFDFKVLGFVPGFLLIATWAIENSSIRIKWPRFGAYFSCLIHIHVSAMIVFPALYDSFSFGRYKNE